MDRLGMRESMDVEIVRANPAPTDKLEPRGKFTLEHWRDGKCIGRREFHNNVTNEGKNRLLNTMFKGSGVAAQISTWYAGLITNGASNSTPTATLAATDNYVNIGTSTPGTLGWAEFTSYTDQSTGGTGAANRPVFQALASSGQTVVNGTNAAVFQATAAGWIYGAFISGGSTTNSTPGDHASGGVLWSEGGFSSGLATQVNIGDQIKLTYSVGC
jgi:hypothetical protein